MKTTFLDFEENGASTTLYVLVHAYNHTPTKLSSIVAALKAREADADILCPKIPATLFSLADPEEIAAEIKAKIDALYAERTYEKVIFVGHSLGALVLRRIYLDAFALGGTPAPWINSVERIIQFAAMGRGWTVNHHLSRLNALAYETGLLLGRTLGMLSGRLPLIMHIHRGAPFLTQLRMDWILMTQEVYRRRAAGEGASHVITIQLLGTIDDVVAPEDNIDPVAGSAFYYRDMPHSGHGDVIDLADCRHASTPDGRCSTRGALRMKVFEEVLGADRETLAATSIHPSDEAFAEADRDVKDVVFVVHGIRDVGYWTHKIARAIIRRANDSKSKCTRTIQFKTSSYGFFPIIDFLQPAKRMEKVGWLVDQYVQARAQYPNAKISYVGHSHGTYLLARALRKYEFCSFNRVIFAGSVVRTRFEWQSFRDNGQVYKMLNYVATGDWVVAFFPKAFELLGIQDLGSAGHDGFKEAKKTGPDFFEVEYIRGDHGAALREENWDEIASFVLDLESDMVPASLRANTQSPIVTSLGQIAPVVPLAILGLVIAGGVWLYQLDSSALSNELLILVYAVLVYRALSRL